MKRFGAVALLVCLLAGTGCGLNPFKHVADAVCIVYGYETEDQMEERLKAEKKAKEKAEKDAKAKAKVEAEAKHESE